MYKGFEWDENKNLNNIKQHGIDFNDAKLVFEEPIIEKVDDRKDYGEIRRICLGVMNNYIVVVVYTYRGNKIRIISIRRASSNERKIYIKETRQSHQLEAFGEDAR